MFCNGPVLIEFANPGRQAGGSTPDTSGVAASRADDAPKTHYDALGPPYVLHERPLSVCYGPKMPML